ncbi:hypothetical protein EJB05_07630 [Eragrostis curvula]|uniref:Uncharacterized protein n=1 Tax=Eragrostis curvula TaxID=38414 RepID=A0A5J9WIX7_9POAL|nr:hypothetical protein EJB05_07630 [Eragrostis curvula]
MNKIVSSIKDERGKLIWADVFLAQPSPHHTVVFLLPPRSLSEPLAPGQKSQNLAPPPVRISSAVNNSRQKLAKLITQSPLLSSVSYSFVTIGIVTTHGVSSSRRRRSPWPWCVLGIGAPIFWGPCAVVHSGPAN